MNNKIHKKLGIVLFITLCLPISLMANTTFKKTLLGTNYEVGYAINSTLDGAYIIVGSVTYPCYSKIYLLKVDAEANILWAKTFAGEQVAVAHTLLPTRRGEFIILGNILSPEDIYLVKTNAQGEFLFAETYGGKEEDIGLDIQPTFDGGYIIVGGTTSYGKGRTDVYLVKLNAQGKLQWSKTYGGKQDDIGTNVIPTPDSGYVVLGWSSSFGKTPTDIYLIKTDAKGKLLWSKTYGGKGYEVGFNIQPTSDGGYLILGNTTSFGAGQTDIYLLKVDSNGTLLWTKTYGRKGYDMGSWLIKIRDGNYLISGWTSSDANYPDIWLLKIDSQGDTIWTRRYEEDGAERSWSVMETDEGGYFILGDHFSPMATSGFDIYLVKTDSLGNVEEVRGGPLAGSSVLLTQVTPFYPNPFTKETHLSYTLPTRGKVTLKIYNITGQLIRTLINKVKEPGYYRIKWDGKGSNGRPVANGIYFYHLEMQDYSVLKKVIKLR